VKMAASENPKFLLNMRAPKWRSRRRAGMMKQL
jgi:hypothetical protein